MIIYQSPQCQSNFDEAIRLANDFLACEKVTGQINKHSCRHLAKTLYDFAIKSAPEKFAVKPDATKLIGAIEATISA